MLKIKRIRTLLNFEKCTLKTELRRLKILPAQHGLLPPPPAKNKTTQKTKNKQTNKQKQNEKQGGEWKCLIKKEG